MAIICSGVAQAEFRVSDLVYVPVVAHTAGANDSLWRSDVMITNIESEDAIDVALVFLPSGLHSNAYMFYDRTLMAGGREEDAFGIFDEELANIAPGATVFLEDVVAKYWPDHTGLNGQGALVVFSYLADTLADDGSREFRNMMVTSRTYNVATIYTPDPENEGEFLEETGTYGQVMPGVPWYDLADGGYRDDTRDYTYLLVGGVEEDEAYRYNLGIVNTSDPQTSLLVQIQPFQEDGQPFYGESEVPMVTIIQIPPLAHVQYYQILGTIFGLTDVQNARIKVSLLSWTSTGVDPKPTFTAYGSLIDNVTNDPMTFTPSFGQPYDVDCIWPDPPEEGEKRTGGLERSLKFPAK